MFNFQLTGFAEIIVRIIFIIISSAIIGYNRGRHNQFAGLKTHILVGIGAGLSFLIPELFYQYHPNSVGDPFRLSAQVISGIGFLGAGSILRTGQSVRGLTTAASLWTTTLIAITFASMEYKLGIVVTLIVSIVLKFGRIIDMTRKYSTKNLLIVIHDQDDNLMQLNDFMEKNVVLKNKIAILENSYDGNQHITKLRYEIIHRQTDLATNDIIKRISEFDFVIKVKSLTELERT